jgi:glycerol-3-phosphate dehydrogenase (NAD(P)+)
MQRVAILGGGGMGTALAVLLGRNRPDVPVTLWVREPEVAASIRERRENTRFLPEVTLPDSVGATSDPAEACSGADLIVVAIPSKFLRAALGELAPVLPAGVPFLSVIKGIEPDTFARPSQIVADVLGPRPLAVLSGPSHAEEFARGLPASVVLAGADEALCLQARDLFMGDTFRVYLNADYPGVELAGALKNVLGVAAGICEGLGFGDNAKAALLTRGLVEMARFAARQGGNPATFWGLAGVGDVLTTCYSPFGRNRAVGLAIGRGEALEAVLSGMSGVAEGVTTTRGVRELARRQGVEMPITEQVHAILFEGKRPREAVTDLMLRDPKVE